MLERQGKLTEWLRATVDKAPTVGQFPQEIFGKPGYAWLLSIILGLGAGLTGPFGTYVYAPAAPRLAYWLFVMPTSFCVWWGIGVLGARLWDAWPKHRAELLIMVPFAMANAAFLVGLHAVLNTSFGTYFPTDWSGLFASHVLTTALVVLPTIWVARRLVGSVSEQAGSDAITFLTEKLPPKLRGALPIALGAEGHYVRVYTDDGDDLVTMTFDDAMKAVVGIPGFQTHRSWWVAKSAAKSLSKSGSAYALELKSGLTVPVGRRRRAEVAENLASSM